MSAALVSSRASAGTDSNLVDDDAISGNFVKQYAGLFTLLQRQIGDASIAQEMLNEAVVTAIEHMRAGRVSQPDRLAGYVYRVAMNLYRNYRREFDNRADLRAGTDDLQQIPSNEPDDVVDDRALHQIRQLIESMPTLRDRELLKRFYLDEEDKGDICRSLKLEPLHFDRVIFRARQRLRVLLEAKGFGPDTVLSVSLAIWCVSFCGSSLSL